MHNQDFTDNARLFADSQPEEVDTRTQGFATAAQEIEIQAIRACLPWPAQQSPDLSSSNIKDLKSYIVVVGDRELDCSQSAARIWTHAQ